MVLQKQGSNLFCVNEDIYIGHIPQEVSTLETDSHLPSITLEDIVANQKNETPSYQLGALDLPMVGNIDGVVTSILPFPLPKSSSKIALSIGYPMNGSSGWINLHRNPGLFLLHHDHIAFCILTQIAIRADRTTLLACIGDSPLGISRQSYRSAVKRLQNQYNLITIVAATKHLGTVVKLTSSKLFDINQIADEKTQKHDSNISITQTQPSNQPSNQPSTQTLENIAQQKEAETLRKNVEMINSSVTTIEPTIKPTINKKSKNYKEPITLVGSDDAFRLSELLFSKIKSRKPDVRTPNMPRWVEHMTKILNTDGRKPEEVQRVIEWATSDSFWSTNILSTAKLREKYDQLVLKMNASRNEAFYRENLDTFWEAKEDLRERLRDWVFSRGFVLNRILGKEINLNMDPSAFLNAFCSAAGIPLPKDFDGKI